MSGGEPSSPSRAIRDTSRRDTALAVICGLLVLGFVGYGVMGLSSRQEAASTNMLSGKVVAKKFTPAPQEEISFGQKGLKASRTAGEYVLEVRVPSEGGRIFQVPVDARIYEAARVGSSQTFLRPRSEQLRAK